MITISMRLLFAGAVAIIAVIAGVLAFVPLYMSAQKAAYTTARDFAETTAAGVASRIDPYFRSAQTALSTILAAAQYQSLDVTKNSTVWNWLHVAFNVSNYTTSVYLDSGMWWSVYYGSSAGTVMLQFGDAAIGSVVTMVANASNVSNVISSQTSSSTYNPTRRPFWSVVRAGRTWSSPFIDVSGQLAVLVAGAPLLNPTTGTSFGVLGVRLQSSTILPYLRTLEPSPNGRVVLFTGTQQFLGGNFAESPILTPTTLKLLSNVQDPLVATAVGWFGGKIHCPSSCEWAIGAGSDGYFIRVSALQDEYGLQVYVMVIIPASDFLRHLLQQSQVGLGSAAGAIVGLVLVAVVVLSFVLRPLTLLKTRIEEFANLTNTQRQATPLIALEEVELVEDACGRLAGQLKLVKSFLPPGVVETLESHGDLKKLVETPVATERAAPTHASASATATTVGPTLARSSETEEEFSDSDRSVESIQVSLGSHGSASSLLPCTSKITVVMINFRRTLDIALCGSVSLLYEKVSYATKCLIELSRHHHAVLEWISGDRFTFSFSTANGQHHAIAVTRAAELVLNLVSNRLHLFNADDAVVGFRGLAIGVATSQAVSGYFGCSKMRRPIIFGKCVNQSAYLMDLARDLNVSNVFAPNTRESLTDFEFAHLALLEKFPGGDTTPGQKSIASMLTRAPPSTGKKRPAAEVRERALESFINSCFEKLSRGEIDVARSLALQEASRRPNHPLVQNALRMVTAATTTIPLPTTITTLLAVDPTVSLQSEEQ